MARELVKREAARKVRGDLPKWNHTTIRYAADAWELPRLSTGHQTRAIRLLADPHWQMDNQHKGLASMDAALEATVCRVCEEGHKSQYYWVCQCHHVGNVPCATSPQ